MLKQLKRVRTRRVAGWVFSSGESGSGSLGTAGMVFNEDLFRALFYL